MDSLFEQILLGLALAMDCFSVSIASGMVIKQFDGVIMPVMALCFGLFQALMPVIGWIATVFFGDYVSDYDHWIAFALLAFIGIKMVIDQFHDSDNKDFNPTSFGVILVLALATSIDALAIGVSFTCTGLDSFDKILQPVAIIGITSFLMSLIGSTIGVTAGRLSHFPAELIGGVILIGIGAKTLLEHLGML